MTRLSRKESRAHTCERLIQSARECIAQSGYTAASIDAIAENAGFSKGAFYSNFDSKESIMLEILERIHNEDIDDLRAILGTSANAIELDRALDRWAEARYRQSEWAKLNVELQLHATRSVAFASQYAICFLRYRQQLAELISLNAAKHGKEMLMHADDLAAALIALADGLALQHTLGLSSGGKDITGMMIRHVGNGWLSLGKPLV